MERTRTSACHPFHIPTQPASLLNCYSGPPCILTLHLTAREACRQLTLSLLSWPLSTHSSDKGFALIRIKEPVQVYKYARRAEGDISITNFVTHLKSRLVASEGFEPSKIHVFETCAYAVVPPRGHCLVPQVGFEPTHKRGLSSSPLPTGLLRH